MNGKQALNSLDSTVLAIIVFDTLPVERRA